MSRNTKRYQANSNLEASAVDTNHWQAELKSKAGMITQIIIKQTSKSKQLSKHKALQSAIIFLFMYAKPHQRLPHRMQRIDQFRDVELSAH